jgi:hypothetical protein
MNLYFIEIQLDKSFTHQIIKILQQKFLFYGKVPPLGICRYIIAKAIKREFFVAIGVCLR